jgi:hypothetical protein
MAPLPPQAADQPTPLSEFGDSFDHRPSASSRKVFGLQATTVAAPGVFGHHSRSLQVQSLNSLVTTKAWLDIGLLPPL